MCLCVYLLLLPVQLLRLHVSTVGVNNRLQLASFFVAHGMNWQCARISFLSADIVGYSRLLIVYIRPILGHIMLVL